MPFEDFIDITSGLNLLCQVFRDKATPLAVRHTVAITAVDSREKEIQPWNAHISFSFLV